ncbi:MAG: hypothetical protein MUC63_05400 [Planctomycetes bacterium]|nr:hypothetical protein [Planctomycetota bacterium]
MRAKQKATSQIQGSESAKRAAQAVLEVLSGLKGPTEGAEALGVSLPRYYVLETRGLEGLVKGLEPREKGKREARPEDRLAEVSRERDRLKSELERMKSLVRAAQRSVGLPQSTESKREKPGKGKGVVKCRTVNRAKRALSRLKAASADPAIPEDAGARGGRGAGAGTGPPKDPSGAVPAEGGSPGS